MNLSVEQTGPADLIVFDNGAIVAEIRRLKLTCARFRPGGRSLIGNVVPMPLYWMQYANHQDPERNAGSNGQVTLISSTPDAAVIECKGTTALGSCRSTFLVTIRGDQTSERYTYQVDAKLEVVAEKGWKVTSNPYQGEVEFANLWPDGVFSPEPSDPKLYEACYLITSSHTERIPHHHLESSDKHNIPMQEGDQFLWLGEDENPCLRLLTSGNITAGVCAYMWDTHFAFEICSEGKDVIVPCGAEFHARYELSSLSRVETLNTLRDGLNRPSPELALIPIVENGINRFAKTLNDVQGDLRFVWPWETEGDNKSSFMIDRSCGYDDLASARVGSIGRGRACWKATSLGPEYGHGPLPDHVRYKLTAFVKSSELTGSSTIAIRIHQENNGSVFDLSNYETFTSAGAVQGNADWTKLDVITPPISPAPDRLHLLLIQDGKGTSWFDNVLWEVLT